MRIIPQIDINPIEASRSQMYANIFVTMCEQSLFHIKSEKLKKFAKNFRRKGIRWLEYEPEATE